MPSVRQSRREHLKKLRREADLGGGPERTKRQHDQGKSTARERIDRLMDPGSFIEFDRFVVHRCQAFGMDRTRFLGDGVVTGVGEIGGQKVALYSQDFTCWGGALGAAHARKICKIMDFALENRIPMVGINDSGGARIQEGVESLAGYAEIFYRNVKCSGVIPQISLVMGPCAGGAVYSPAVTDFVFMVDGISYMFVTGPDVIKAVTHEEVSKEALGGSRAHNESSGVANFHCADEDECFERVRELLAYIPPGNFREQTPKHTNDIVFRDNNAIRNIVPDNPKKPYDMRKIILEVVDDGCFLECSKGFAGNIITGFASVGGVKIGVIANQPDVLAGVLDIDSSCKGARFIRFCDAFDVPILTFVDVPGFLPGVDQEHRGIIRHGSKLLYAYAEATVPTITLITRKAYGGAYDVMASKHLRADVNLAYPTAEIAVMGAEGAVNVIFRKELQGLEGEAREERKRRLVQDYEERFSNPYRAAELGYVDSVILPEETRKRIYEYLVALRHKKVELPRRKHGNIQL